MILFDLLFGGVFFFAGICATIGLVAGGIESGEMMLFLMAVVFCLAFCGVGLGFLIAGFKKIKQNQDIERYGKTYYAKIVAYRDSNVSMNGVPILVLTLIYYDNHGTIHAIDIDTGQTSETPYPLGETTVIKIYNGVGKLVKGTVGYSISSDIEAAFEDYITEYNERKEKSKNFLIN